jgi:2-octaprenyl-6-methoxyphenol hydroxylase
VTQPGHPLEVDLAIAGAGPIGLALAGWLAARGATSTLSIALIDAGDARATVCAPRGAAAVDSATQGAQPVRDPRAIALSQGSRTLLEQLGWPADATPIHRIHVSQHGHFGRTVIDREEHGLPALGYVARYDRLLAALVPAVQSSAVHWLANTGAGEATQDGDGVTVALGGAGPQRSVRARILINAEGGLFDARERQDGASGAGPDGRRTRDYGQTAIVGVVTVSAPQPNVAWERFTAGGPIALLPCGGPRDVSYALVWCMRPPEAERRLALGDAELLAELGAFFGERLGRFESIGARAAFSLGLKTLDAQVDGRIAAIGNAAQTLHPVAGQGLNLGLRDARTLVEALAHDGATPQALARFAQRRRLDRRLTIGATDTLARAFTLEAGPVALLRGLALAALEFAPPIKAALARQMMLGQRR